MVTHMIPTPPPPSPPQYIYQLTNSINSNNINNVITEISDVTACGSTMGGKNKQASFRSRNNNRQVKNMFSKQRMGRATAVSESAPTNIATNEADSNADTCYLGTNFIPIAYTNHSDYIYPYSDSYEPLENFPIFNKATAYDHPSGSTYIFIFHESLYYCKQMKHSLINPNHI